MLEIIINNYIAEKRVKNIRHHDKFRVSDAGRCHLMRYWKRQRKPVSDVPDSRTQRVFEAGHVFHVWLQDLLQEKDLLIVREKEVEDSHRIGHIDAIVMDGEARILYDFKTVHSRKFHYKQKDGNNKDMHYAVQAYTYAIMSPVCIDDVRIAYISKDDLCIEEVSVEKTYPNISSLYENDWFPLFEAWERQEEPKANPAEWECKYCIYRSSCPHAGGVR